MNLEQGESVVDVGPEGIVEDYDAVDGPSEEEAYLQGTLKPTKRCVTMLTDFFRRVQNHLAACGRPLPRKDSKAIDRWRRRSHARRSKFAQSNL